MNSKVAVILVLILAAALIWGIGYFSHHDRVDNIVNCNTLELGRGRNVHLIGVASSCLFGYETVTGDEKYDSIFSVVPVDSYAVAGLTEKALGQWVTLEYSGNFKPDSSSQDLHAYIRLQDGTDLNAWLIEQGLAWTHPEHEHPRVEMYRDLELKAREQGLGIWGLVADTVDVSE